jgi:hypothetical protein
MDIMHACDFYTFPMAKKRKEKASKDLYIWKPWAILLRKIFTIPTYIAKFYSKYSVCAMSLHSNFPFLLCNSKLMGK